MEMESSRRSLDKAREPGLKKPRLAEEAERDRSSNGMNPYRDRPFLPRNPGGGGGGQPLVSRFKANERDAREDPFRGASYQQQQMQELVAQYKTALAELTFNSKPIITNLTIIAGENLHAAKGIAATVCANILEVPSDQKLPSLYLLDSIVKNIGRDYIKYFAARLPEVFCKAYEQVDSSIHPGMRHLFGTWKGVFPLAPLQKIEKELGFPPVVNGSSSGATASRLDSQAQRPPHSIHVNPKYLEARQRLQQSTGAKGVSSDNVAIVVTTAEDTERPDRTSVIGSSRQWTDPSVKVQRPLRELSNQSVHEKNPGVGFGEHEFASDYSRHSDLGNRRASERVTERDVLEKSWFGIGSGAAEASVDQRNGLDVNHEYGNYRASRSAQPIVQPSSNNQNTANESNRRTSQSWKNSEEEEYMWDDMNSRLTDHEGTDSSMKGGWTPDDAEKPASLQRGRRMTLETEHLGSQWNKFDAFSQVPKPFGGEERVPFFREIEEHLPLARGQHDTASRIKRESSADLLSTGGADLGHQIPAVWPSLEPPLSVVGLTHSSIASRISSQPESHSVPLSSGLSTSLNSSLARIELPHMGPSTAVPSRLGSLANAVSTPSGMFAKQRQQTLRPESPSVDSSASSTPLQHQKSHSSADHVHLQSQTLSQKHMQLTGKSNRVVTSQVMHDSFPIMPQNHIQQSHALPNLQRPLYQTSQNMQNPSVSLTSFPQLRHHLPFLQQSQSDQSLQQTQSQTSIQMQKPLSPPLSFGSTQANGTSNLNNPGGDILDQSSTSNLLAAIMKSGLISNSSVSSLQNLNIQPPLPNGPPPVKVLTPATTSVPLSSAIGPISLGYTPTAAANPPKPVLPPLPPGPPPPSSLVGTSSMVSNKASANPNPFSSLLSSLVAKGLISSPATEMPGVTSVQMPNQLLNQSLGFATSTSMDIASTSDSSIVPSSSSPNELSLPESSSPNGIALSKVATANLEDLIGMEFKPEIIRELHPVVINCLFDDLKHQCLTCGLRFKLQEQLSTHFDWHASRKSEMGRLDRVSRKWYVNLSDWVAASVEPSYGSMQTASLERTVLIPDKWEPMVPADESQSICALCGEPFEDFYCNESDEWMYKGTVYMNLPAREGDTKTMDVIGAQGPVVHAKCVSKSLTDDLELEVDDDKMDQIGG